MAITKELAARGFLDEESTARLFGIEPLTLRAWRSRGRGPAYVKIGKTVFYQECDLDAFIAAGRRMPGRAADARPRKAA